MKYFIASFVALNKDNGMEHKPDVFYAKNRYEAESIAKKRLNDLYPRDKGYKKGYVVVEETSPFARLINGLGFEEGDTVYACSVAATLGKGDDTLLSNMILVICGKTEQIVSDIAYNKVNKNYPIEDKWKNQSARTTILLTHS